MYLLYNCLVVVRYRLYSYARYVAGSSCNSSLDYIIYKVSVDGSDSSVPSDGIMINTTKGLMICTVLSPMNAIDLP